ncbi:MAG: FmdB family zinc ribbon protein [Terriglobia bacterium]
MPVYQFVCKECKKSFNLTMGVAEHGKGKFACPKCKSRKVEQRLQAFYAVTSKKA